MAEKRIRGVELTPIAVLATSSTIVIIANTFSPVPGRPARGLHTAFRPPIPICTELSTPPCATKALTELPSERTRLPESARSAVIETIRSERT